MVRNVKTDLAGRINQYVNYRRKVERSSGKFVETLSQKNDVAKTRTARIEPKADRQPAGTGRRAVRQRTRHARTARRSTSIRRYYPKHITKKQAVRLAKYAPVIQDASRRYGVPIELVCAVILQESGGNFKAVSHCGARGLMQLMPSTAKRLGVRNSFDPVQNIMGGTKYIRMLLDRFDGNVALALAGYNAGEGNVEKYGRRIPPFKETRAYVPNVLKYADTLWSLLRTSVRRVDVRPVVHHRTLYGVTRRA